MPKAAKPKVTARTITSYAKKQAAVVRRLQRTHSKHDPMVSVRTAEHRGHKIVIKTNYEISIDGKPVHGHLGVDNAGQVHYHPIPNVAFASAIDLVKSIIDVFPDEFAQGGTSGGGQPIGHHATGGSQGKPRGVADKRKTKKSAS